MVHVISPPFPEIWDALPCLSPHGSKGMHHGFSVNMFLETVFLGICRKCFPILYFGGIYTLSDGSIWGTSAEDIIHSKWPPTSSVILFFIGATKPYK
jgi:hypothetical protein